MTPYQCQRIRFGILAARHYYARQTLTDTQLDDLEALELTGWRVHDSLRAWDRECQAISARRFRDQLRSERMKRFLPGDLVRISLPENDICNDMHNGKGVVTHGPDDGNGWIVASAPGGLRCVASELTMITPREERDG